MTKAGALSRAPAAFHVLLVRHGRPHVAPGLCYGRLDVGADAAPALAARLGRVRATVWTSPSRRCRALANAVAATRRRRPVVDRRLLELDFGRFEGTRWDDVPRDAVAAWSRALLGRPGPDGESGAALIVRVRAFARRLRRIPGRHIVVSHGGPLLVLRALLERRPVDLAARRQPFATCVAIARVEQGSNDRR